MKEVAAPASPKARVLSFIDAFRRAPNDADIEISLGMDAAYKAALMVNVAGSIHILYVDEARRLADTMERSMNECSTDPESATLPNIIMMLRMACDKADAGFSGRT